MNIGGKKGGRGRVVLKMERGLEGERGSRGRTLYEGHEMPCQSSSLSTYSASSVVRTKAQTGSPVTQPASPPSDKDGHTGHPRFLLVLRALAFPRLLNSSDGRTK